MEAERENIEMTRDKSNVIMEIKKLSFSYSKGKTIFQHVNFEIKKGEIISILGPNGSGKSTLLNCLAGILLPTNGEILIGGKSIKNMKQNTIAQMIGYVPQATTPSYGFHVIDYIVTGCAPHMGTFERPKKNHYDIAWKAVKTMGIEHISEKPYTEISGGERQQVSIARTIAQNPEVILLDEPTSHLDYGNQVRVLKIIRQMARDGFAIIMTTHNPDHVLLLDGMLAVLDGQGALKFGEGKDMMSEELLRNLYGIDLKLLEVDGVNRKVCVAPKI